MRQNGLKGLQLPATGLLNDNPMHFNSH